MRGYARLPIAWAAALAALALTLRGAEEAQVRPEDIIDVQNEVKAQLDNLVKRLSTVVERMEKISAEDAEKIKLVERELRRLDISADMGAASRQVSEKNLAAAIQAQERVIANLKAIIDSLEGRRLDAQNWEARLARVKEAGARIKDLLGKQRALEEESRGGVESGAEAAALEDFARRLEGLAAAQQRLAEKLPEGPLPDENAIKELIGKVAALRTRQDALAARTQAAPGEAELAPLREKADALLGAVTRNEINADTRAGVEDMAKAVKSELNDAALAEALRGAAGMENDTQRQNAARALRQVKEKTAKGAGLSPFAPEQAELEFKTRELAREAAAASQGDTARTADEAAGALKNAAEAMERAASGLKAGEQKQAADAQAEAARELGAAQDSLAKASGALGRRDSFERAKAVQGALKEQAEALKEALSAQAEKLRRKDRAKPLDDANEALARAEEAMDKAGASFGERRQEGAAQAGEAAEELRAAKDALKEEALKQLKRHDLEGLARKQDELGKQAKDTARGLKEDGDAALKRAGGRVERAGGQMDRAARDFQSGQAEEGAKAQKEAERELAKAVEEIGEEEEELARLKQEEALTSMVALLVRLHDGERGVLEEILKAEESRQDGKLPRKTVFQLRNVAKAHAGLQEEGEKVRALLDNERARVFAFVVEDVLGDMSQIKDALGREDTGAFTQMLVAEVIVKIEKLLAALKKELAERQEEGQQQQDQQGQQRLVLVPPVAEAMMLRDMQQEINAQTLKLQSARDGNEGRLTEAMERQLTRLALKQGALGGLTKRLARDFFGIVPEENANEAPTQE